MPASLLQSAAVLGRVKVLARGLCLGIQREFEYVRAIGDWHRKLRVMRAACWSLHAAICEETPSWVAKSAPDEPDSVTAAAICRPWIQRCLSRIDRELDDIQSWLSPGYEQRATRFSAERAIKATFSILRVITDVSHWLESAQVETGVDTNDSRFDSLVWSWALPNPLGADPFALLESDFADADAVFGRSLPLELFIVMRSMWCHYQFALAINSRRAADTRLNERIRELHIKSIEKILAINRERELGIQITTSFFSPLRDAAAIIAACIDVLVTQERELGEPMNTDSLATIAKTISNAQSNSTETLGNLASHWLVESYLLPEFPLSPGDMPVFQNLADVISVRRELLTNPLTRQRVAQPSSVAIEKLRRIKGAAFLDAVTAIESAMRRKPPISATWRTLITDYGLNEGDVAKLIPKLLSNINPLPTRRHAGN